MSELKVGLLALSAIISVVYMSLKITSNQSGFGDYTTYRTIISDASGIFPKTPIKVAGINAGRIKSIELQENSALITFEVLNRVRVTNNSKLSIKSVGFLGDKYLEIKIGDSANHLEEGSLIQSIEGAGMEKLVRDASEVLGDVKVLVKSLKESIVPEGEESPVKILLQNLKEVSKSAKEMMANLNDTVSGNRERIDNLIANFENFSRNLDYQFDPGHEDAAMRDLKLILANAKRLSGDLQALVSDIKAGKGTMGKILVEEKIADEVKETLAGVKKIVNKVDSIRTELSMFTGGTTKGDSYTDVNLRIYPSPERFYLLGIATSEEGPESERETTTIVDGVESTEVRKEKDKDTYRFNVLLGRRIHNWTFRGGLIESTGGLGVDYDRVEWGSRFSMEVFDYREDEGPNLRLVYRLRLWNVFYGKLAVDDTITNDERNAIISAGLRFNDEDLKGLLGFFF